MNKKKDEKLLKTIINSMFEHAGIPQTYDGLIEQGVTKTDMLWMDKYSMSDAQHTMWRAHCIQLIKRHFKVSYKQAENEFAWLDLMYGLKVENQTKPDLTFEDLA